MKIKFKNQKKYLNAYSIYFNMAWLNDFYITDYCPWENLHPVLYLFKRLFERIKYRGILDRFLVK
jgi:hypothetical protein